MDDLTLWGANTLSRGRPPMSRKVSRRCLMEPPGNVGRGRALAVRADRYRLTIRGGEYQRRAPIEGVAIGNPIIVFPVLRFGRRDQFSKNLSIQAALSKNQASVNSLKTFVEQHVQIARRLRPKLSQRPHCSRSASRMGAARVVRGSRLRSGNASRRSGCLAPHA